jgi:hypothetical protein
MLAIRRKIVISGFISFRKEKVVRSCSLYDPDTVPLRKQILTDMIFSGIFVATPYQE